MQELIPGLLLLLCYVCVFFVFYYHPSVCEPQAEVTHAGLSWKVPWECGTYQETTGSLTAVFHVSHLLSPETKKEQEGGRRRITTLSKSRFFALDSSR